MIVIELMLLSIFIFLLNTIEFFGETLVPLNISIFIFLVAIIIRLTKLFKQASNTPSDK